MAKTPLENIKANVAKQIKVLGDDPAKEPFVAFFSGIESALNSIGSEDGISGKLIAEGRRVIGVNNLLAPSQESNGESAGAGSKRAAAAAGVI